MTSYPSFRPQLEHVFQYDDTSRVVVDAKVITSRSPGTALEFALAILGELCGQEVRASVGAGLVLFPGQH